MSECLCICIQGAQCRTAIGTAMTMTMTALEHFVRTQHVNATTRKRQDFRLFHRSSTENNAFVLSLSRAPPPTPDNHQPLTAECASTQAAPDQFFQMSKTNRKNYSNLFANETSFHPQPKRKPAFINHYGRLGAFPAALLWLCHRRSRTPPRLCHRRPPSCPSL